MKYVTALFDTYAAAGQAVGRLKEAGIQEDAIAVYAPAAQRRQTGDISETDLVATLRREGVTEADAHAYAEGVERGGTVVSVRAADERAAGIADMLEHHDAVDMDAREGDWRRSGWTGLFSGAGGDKNRAAGAPRRDGSDQVIPVVEERLSVGKREVNRGRVRIHSHVIEKPVEETVRLRNEHVEVERRPAEGTVSGDTLRDRTIEMTERDEEAVVSKNARVVEEVVVHKDAKERVETVRDTVRRTEVDVERDPPRETGTTGTPRRDGR